MKKYRRANSDAPHVRLYFAMMDSEAWKTLPATARCLYIEILKEWAGKDKNEIKLSYSAIRLRTGFGNRAISQGFVFLDHLGFITRKCGGGLFRSCSTYALSDRWKDISIKPEVLEETFQKIELEIRGRRKRRRSKTGAIENPEPVLANYKCCSK